MARQQPTALLNNALETWFGSRSIQTGLALLCQVGWNLGCTRKAYLAVDSGFCLVIKCLQVFGWFDLWFVAG